MYGKMLVPLDGSSMAEMAVPYAVEIASGAGSELILMSVSQLHEDESHRLYRTYLGDVEAQVRSQLQARGARESTVVRMTEGATVHIEVGRGRPAERLLTYARTNNVTLIVMASRGRSGPGQWPLGNIAAKVLRAAGVPVLLVRNSTPDTGREPNRLIKKILLPLDGSELGESAMFHASALAILLGAEMVLFHVLEPDSTVGNPEGIVAPAPIPEQGERRKRLAEEYLEGVACKLRDRALTVSTAVTRGQAADEIVEYAESNRIDLVAMATHGRSGIGRWVFGSVTDKVLHAGDMPVLTVPPA
jgi:nucleotide-binding universal stress UspA family protein